MSFRDRPLLYFGDVSSAKREGRARAVCDCDDDGLSWPMMVIVTCWFPAIVLHELTHYAVARLLGIDIRGVVLFQYSSTYVGTNLLGSEADPASWKREIVQLAPLFVCGPIAVIGLLLIPATSSLAATVGLSVLTSGYVYCAIPDQLRTAVLRWLDSRDDGADS